ncbi:MAG: phosphotransferase family protein [Lactobacillus sp.]|nr:phosphotransferase family protein [Lactobacillus sp.]
MDFNLEQGWEILPIGGDTGTAYMAVNNDERIFLKRNTSPFLAALSLEEIVPRLIWSKRTISGDTLTAQEWLNGRSLKRNEMCSLQVSKLLYRLHHSSLLKKMLLQVGGQAYTPTDLLAQYFNGLSDDLRQHPLLHDVSSRLKEKQPQLERSNYEVCHGDLNHKNWLLSESGQLYLVDWETVKLADPALDLSMLMCQYVPRKDWKQWLERYEKRLPTAEMMMRINWYAMINLLLVIKHNYQRGHFHEMNQDIIKLSQVIKNQNYI